MGLKTVNWESLDLLPSPEIQRESGEDDYGGTSFLQLLELHEHLASTREPPRVNPAQMGTEYSLKGKLLDFQEMQEHAYFSTATGWTSMVP